MLTRTAPIDRPAHGQDIVRHDGSFYKDGYLEMPNKPGLGIELNDEVCRRYLAEGSGYFE